MSVPFIASSLRSPSFGSSPTSQPAADQQPESSRSSHVLGPAMIAAFSPPSPFFLSYPLLHPCRLSTQLRVPLLGPRDVPDGAHVRILVIQVLGIAARREPPRLARAKRKGCVVPCCSLVYQLMCFCECMSVWVCECVSVFCYFQSGPSTPAGTPFATRPSCVGARAGSIMGMGSGVNMPCPNTHPG